MYRYSISCYLTSYMLTASDGVPAFLAPLASVRHLDVVNQLAPISPIR